MRDLIIALGAAALLYVFLEPEPRNGNHRPLPRPKGRALHDFHTHPLSLH
jgi:hypothetical protein